MSKPNQFKEVEIQDGEKTLSFRIKEFTPAVGCYWAFRVFGNIGVATMGISGFEETINKFINMQRKEFEPLMNDCLEVVSVKMESGWHPLFSEFGGYAIADIKNTIVFQLVMEALSFSLAPFFDKNLIATIKGQVLASFLRTGPENS